ncbi:MAG: DUF364 domain-containing protein [Eubacteriales bacterium]|nr:DUF364 domain-containing protein [Eubacteriales bacterium]
MKDLFSIYDTIIDGIERGTVIESCFFGNRWAMAEAGNAVGIAMATGGESIPTVFPSLEGMDVKDAAQAIKSWNFREASLAMAAVNLWYNTPERMAKLGCAEPFKNYSTAGLDVTGMTVAAIGHLKLTEEIYAKAKEVYIIEKEPQNGDYPDSACDFILPKCDLVVITGSALVNKTLPHLLELSRNACTILMGPTVPMCPALLDFGIDRLSGFVCTDAPSLRAKVEEGSGGSPYYCGESWLLK